MEVDKISFYPRLLDILTDISESRFVAVDLELSGVPSKQMRGEAGKPTLQQRYLETKEAADRYQILQFGLTCVTRDAATGKYILKPYNFDLNPLIDERLDLERIFSFQSGAADFLLKTGFDLGRPFRSGVPYLSRAEDGETVRKHAKQQDKNVIADIQIKPTETESLAFVAHVRHTINTWLARKKADRKDSVTIFPVRIENGRPADELSRFERRLVHQLVRAEFPDLVTLGKRGLMQISRYDQKREGRIAAERKKELAERINRQKGLRWVIEALLGSDLSSLDLRECARDPATGENIFADMDEYRAQFDRAHHQIRKNPRMLVGHNCFLDLIYVYRTFIGELPATVTEFQRKLHTLWPHIVDTKYMSTHNCGDINPVSSLQQIASQLSAQKTPKIEVDPKHKKYERTEAFHEAGYDSFLTAQIATRLSSRLEREGSYIEAAVDKVSNGIAKATVTNDTIATNTAHVNGSTITNGESSSASDTFTVVGRAKGKRRNKAKVLPKSGPIPADVTHDHEAKAAAATTNNATVDAGIPESGSDFWRVYGNRLRVFGTEESVCVLDGSDAEGLESEDGGVKVECP